MSYSEDHYKPFEELVDHPTDSLRQRRAEIITRLAGMTEGGIEAKGRLSHELARIGLEFTERNVTDTPPAVEQLPGQPKLDLSAFEVEFA